MTIERNLVEKDPLFSKNNSVFLHEHWDGRKIDEVVDLALKLAEESPTGRFNFMAHKGLTEEVHFLFNAVYKNSYVQPHSHNNGGDRRETFSAVKGHFWVVVFDEQGAIEKIVRLDSQNPTNKFTVETGKIHTVLSDVSFVTFELKQHPKGGYNSEIDKVFAPWSLSAKDEGAKTYYDNLLEFVLKIINSNIT